MDRSDAITAIINATSDDADMEEVVRALFALGVDMGELEDVDPGEGPFNEALDGVTVTSVNVASGNAVVGIQCGGSVHGSTVHMGPGRS